MSGFQEAEGSRFADLSGLAKDGCFRVCVNDSSYHLHLYIPSVLLPVAVDKLTDVLQLISGVTSRASQKPL